MNKKSEVGVLNFQYSKHNYGAVLQAAALEHIIKSLGFNVKHIDFEVKQKLSTKSKIVKLLQMVGLKKNKTPIILNEEAFELFRSQFIQRTSKVHTAKEFRHIAKRMDAVIVGSDQVWRPRMAKDLLAFFLAYVPKGVKRVSYAASFGSSEWEASDQKKITKRIKHELSLFKGISVRENSGVDICREIFEVHAIHVLDPLLLVDSIFYKKVLGSSNNIECSDIVYYKLDSDSAFSEDLKIIGKHYNAKPQNIYLKKGTPERYQEVSDWLSMIHNSKVVVTDSFHCICLALLFDKTVIYCPNEIRGQARMDSLFQIFDIKLDNIKLDLLSDMYELSKPEAISAILQEKRKESLDFLIKSLEV